jgi:hypothetical protein
MHIRLVLLLAVAASVASVAALAAPSRGAAAPDAYCGPSGGAATASVDTGLQELFRAYGNDPEPGHWTGADTTNSVLLPDGRDLWIFSDTFLGKVNPDETRAPWPETPLSRNVSKWFWPRRNSL